jgi:hypothetical protein
VSQQINLYNPSLGPQRALASAQNVAVAAAIAIVVLGAAGSLAESQRGAHKAEATQAAEQLKMVQDRVQQLAQQAASAKPDPALQAEVERLTTLVDSRNTVLSVLEKGTNIAGSGYAEILRGLARQTVAGLWLTDINVAGSGGEMELKGRTTDRTLVAEYLGRLNGEKVFAGRSFAGLRLEAPKADDQGAQARAPAYLEFSLSGSQEKAVPVGTLGEPGTVEERVKAISEGKEKKS